MNFAVKHSDTSRNGFGRHRPFKNTQNGLGIYIVAAGKCNTNFEDITSTYNRESGMRVTCVGGGDIELNDATTSNNDGDGINVVLLDETTVVLEGTITSNYNRGSGLQLATVDTDVKLNVKGRVNLDSNSDAGLVVLGPDPGSLTTVGVVVDEGGSLQSCGNRLYDIQTFEDDVVTWTGNFACDQDKLRGTYVPNCEPCPFN